MKKDIENIFYALSIYLEPQVINNIVLPERLLDPRTEEEKGERFTFIYHSLIGPLTLEIIACLNRGKLSIEEISMISERLQAFLIENGITNRDSM